MERRFKPSENVNVKIAIENVKGFLGDIDIPKINEDTWTTLIEQFLMLILIVGRWLLPKGDLTRDQLSQLLLVYIGKLYFKKLKSSRNI